MQPQLRQQIHSWIYIGGLSMLCVGMPASTFLMSLSQLVIGLNWIAEMNFSAKWKRFTSNKAALVLCSFFVMHLIGLLYTSDYDYGLEDVRKKIPLLIMPFLLCTSGPVSEKGKKIILFFFIGTVTVVSFIGLYRVLRHTIVDIHDISPFVSSIRLSLMIVLSVFLLLGYIFSQKWKATSLILLVWVAWLLVFLIIMESLTGVVITGIIGIILLVYYAIKRIRLKKPLQGFAIMFVMVAGIIGTAVYLVQFHAKYFPPPEKVEVSTLDKNSPSGNFYLSYSSHFRENGHPVTIYIAYPELRREWNKRSRILFDSNDKKGNGIRYTLLRYMSSLNLRKDSGGMSKLTAGDIRAIENGIPNYNFTATSSMEFRLYQAMWEVEDYRMGGDLSGHSITQRLEFWRAAIGIIEKHWLVGVGTGNVKKAFAAQYDEMHSSLHEKFRLRSHNQYLEIMVGFGVIGLVWMLFSLIYPAVSMKKFYSYAYIIFWLICVFSMFSEDTLETQAGATFYAFFNSFFLFTF